MAVKISAQAGSKQPAIIKFLNSMKKKNNWPMIWFAVFIFAGIITDNTPLFLLGIIVYLDSPEFWDWIYSKINNH